MNEIGLRREIAKRREAEDSQELLIAELHHRVKNTLSTVQALIQLNLRSSPTIEDFRGTIGGRIESLAKTHTLLTHKRWHAIAFRDILNSELEPYQQTEQVTLSGPDFDLEAEVATTVGMVIHELTTNAAKYGALSVSFRHALTFTGPLKRRKIGPTTPTRSVTLNWRERGGPPMPAAGQKGLWLNPDRAPDRPAIRRRRRNSNSARRRPGLPCRISGSGRHRARLTMPSALRLTKR